MKNNTFVKFIEKLRDQHTIELLPLVFILSLFPFYYGGETLTVKVIFLAFPLLYFPIVLMRKRYIYRSHFPVFWAWIGFLVVNLVSMFFSISLALSVPKFFEILGIFLYFVLFYLIVDREKDLKFLSNSILVVGFWLALMSLYFFFNPPLRIPVINLVYAKYGHNHLVNYLIFVLPIAMVRFLQQKTKLKNVLWGFVVIFFFVSLYLTFARAAFFIVPIITFFIVKSFKLGVLKKKLLVVLGALPVVLLIAVFVFSQFNFAQKLISPLKTTNFGLWRQIVKPFENEGRREYWRQAIEGFKLKPMFGNGPGTFRLTSNRFKQKETISWFTHNSFLQAATETGLLGFFSFVGLLFFSFKKIKIPKKYKQHMLPLFLGVVGAFFQSLFNFNFNFLAILLLFWVVVAVILKLSVNGKKVRLAKKYSFSIVIVGFSCIALALSSVVGGFYILRAKETENFSILQALNYYKLAMHHPSVDHSRFYSYLQFASSAQEKMSLDIPADYIIAWNKEDPEVYFRLANIYKDTGDPIVDHYYKKAVDLYSKNIDYSFSYASYLVSRKDYLSAYRVLLQSGISASSYVFSKDEESRIRKYIQSDEIKLTIEDLSKFAVASPQHKDRLGAKMYYLIGLQYFQEKNFKDALFFWKAATQIAPEWGHFHLELINLYVAIDQENLAWEQFEKCFEFHYAGESCQKYKNDVLRWGFFVPGSLEKEVRDIQI